MLISLLRTCPVSDCRSRHPDPGRFAEESSGTERTVAEYLLAKVLDRQPEPMRLLLRTSVLERVLQDLDAANAFVVALDSLMSCQ
jgi:LuxR family transcriptional regulator, maltose regulon positive regulatory protein